MRPVSVGLLVAVAVGCGSQPSGPTPGPSPTTASVALVILAPQASTDDKRAVRTCLARAHVASSSWLDDREVQVKLDPSIPNAGQTLTSCLSRVRTVLRPV